LCPAEVIGSRRRVGPGGPPRGTVSSADCRSASQSISERIGMTAVRAPACRRNQFLGEARRGPSRPPSIFSWPR
jgi:hypothetical protein